MTRWRPVAFPLPTAEKYISALQNGPEDRRKVQVNQSLDYDLRRSADSRNSALQIAFGSRPAAEIAGEAASSFFRMKYPINN